MTVSYSLARSEAGACRGGANGATALGIQRVKLQKLHFIEMLYLDFFFVL